jgi:hypothetical protein
MEVPSCREFVQEDTSAMNRGVLLLGAIAVAGMSLYPPWNCVAGAGDSKRLVDSAGYSPIYAPPHRPYIAPRSGGLYPNAGQSSCTAEVSWSQLGVQCGAVAVLTLALALAKKK